MRKTVNDASVLTMKCPNTLVPDDRLFQVSVVALDVVSSDSANSTRACAADRGYDFRAKVLPRTCSSRREEHGLRHVRTSRVFDRRERAELVR